MKFNNWSYQLIENKAIETAEFSRPTFCRYCVYCEGCITKFPRSINPKWFSMASDVVCLSPEANCPDCISCGDSAERRPAGLKASRVMQDEQCDLFITRRLRCRLRSWLWALINLKGGVLIVIKQLTLQLSN